MARQHLEETGKILVHQGAVENKKESLRGEKKKTNFDGKKDGSQKKTVEK